MSFIVAKKYSNRIRIFSDNKMTVNPDDEDILIKGMGIENYKKIKALGIIKNVIINENICICSAGILEDFNKLLEYVDTNQNKSFDDICIKALEINNQNNSRTDFIICTTKDNNRIVEIKNNKMLETESSWIGSKDCFEMFQIIRHSEEMIQQTIYDCETKKEIPIDDESIDSMSFSKVLQSHINDSVGEELVECTSENNKFYYTEKLSTSISKPRTLEHGKHLNLYDNVFDGGYTYYVYNSSDNYKMYIEQLRCGIEYCPHIKYEKFNHLRVPKFEYCDVVDFEKKHNCGNCSIVMSI